MKDNFLVTNIFMDKITSILLKIKQSIEKFYNNE